MNKCVFHPHNHAVVQCDSCGRSLCPACDHRIKGFPYCQECIVSGIELLRQRNSAINSMPFAHRRSSPLAATVLSFVCPGLGAAYNGQNAKALAHFGVFVGLFQMAVLSGFPIFVFGFLGMWLFAAVDAFRTARAIKLGYAPQADDFLTRRLSDNPLVWAISLITLGTLFSLNTFFGIRLPVRELLPILLIALGVYWLIYFVRRRSYDTASNQSYDSYPSAILRDADETTYASVNAARFRSGKF
jgi:TM2 domain-containing membrane protein YozV